MPGDTRRAGAPLLGNARGDGCANAANPLLAQAGILFGWFGEPGSTPPPFPAFDCFAAPASHVFAFKGLWNGNWLQAVEVGIDPVHPSFLHRFFEDLIVARVTASSFVPPASAVSTDSRGRCRA